VISPRRRRSDHFAPLPTHRNRRRAALKLRANLWRGTLALDYRSAQSGERPDPDWRPSRLLRLLAFAAAAALLLFLLLFLAEKAAAARGHVFDPARTIGTKCEGVGPCAPGSFKEPAGVAVFEAAGANPSVLYVSDRALDRVQYFDAATGAYLGFFDGSGTNPGEGATPAGGGGAAEEVPTGRFDEPEGIAVDNDPASPSFGDVYVVDVRERLVEEPNPGEFVILDQPVVDKFTAAGEYVGQITRNVTGAEFSERGFLELFGIAVDPAGQVWIEIQNPGSAPNEAAHYDNTVANTRIGSVSTNTGQSGFAAPGFAVDSADDLYVHNTFGSGDRLAKFKPNGELITPTVDDEPPTGVAVEAGSDDVYVAHAGNVHRLTAAGASVETLMAPGAPQFGAPAVDSAAGTVYVADLAAAVIDVFPLAQPGPPTVEAGSTSVADVTATTARLEAVINPRSEPGDAPTTYRFEYGPCATPSSCATSPFTASVPVPAGQLAPNYEPDPVAAGLAGLAPGTTYHFRISAENSRSLEPTLGEEVIFATQASTSSGLLPDGRQWELVSPPDKHGAQLEAIGEAGVVQASADGDAVSYFADAPTEASPHGYSNEVQILSRRLSTSWSSDDLVVPHDGSTGASLGAGNEYRFFSDDLSQAVVQPFGPFLPLSPGASEQTPYLEANFPAADPAQRCSADCSRPLVTGCPAAGSCPAAIEEIADVPPGTVFGNNREDEPECGNQVARNPVVNCRPLFLTGTPDLSHVLIRSKVDLLLGSPEPAGDLYEWGAGHLKRLGTLKGTTEVAAVSDDGSRVVFRGSSEGQSGLILRNTVGGHTIQLDAPAANCPGCTGGNGQFRSANSDATTVLFTDEQPLTADAGAAPNAPDLYECEILEAGPGSPECRLQDLTPAGLGGRPANVLGVLGASADAAWIYYAAGSPSEPHLYALHGGSTALIGVVSKADAWDWESFLQSRRARVSPSGHWLAFLSASPLTGYDNQDAKTGGPDVEVYLYNGPTGQLVCASCNSTGARPQGVEYGKLLYGDGGLAGGNGNIPGSSVQQGISAIVPAGTPVTASTSLYQPRYLSDSGRLFFNSHDALVPQDTNGTMDVYEYEPPAVGNCNGSSPTFAPSDGGCVDLISSGTSPLESAFLDASENGNDVFFLTSARLAPQDTDSERDVYDAHVCSGEAPCFPEPPPAPPVCSGDACQLPATPPVDATPGSLTFSGAGNVVRCPKGKKLNKGKCVKKKAAKKKHHKKSKGKKKSGGKKSKGGK
jgi:hypothetical protein